MKSYRNHSSDISELKFVIQVYFFSLLVAIIVILIAFFLQVALVYKYFESTMLIVPLLLGSVIGFFLGRNILLQRDIRRKHHLFKAVADYGLDFTYFKDPEGKIQYISSSCLSVTGYSTDEFYQDPDLLDKMIYSEDRERWEGHRHELNEESFGPDSEFRIVTKEGVVRWIIHICSPVLDETGDFLGHRSSNLDITKRKEYESKVENLANFDPLTNLPNRRFLLKHIAKSIRHSRTTGEKFAIFFVDMERFKYVNDTYGHSFGDRILKEMSTRFISFCRHCHNVSDWQMEYYSGGAKDFFISRFGGDEFIMVLSPVEEQIEIKDFIQKVADILDIPFYLDGQYLHVSGNIGVSIFPDDGQSAESLIKNADSAMYRAKKESGRKYCFYSEKFSDESFRALSLENRLNQAIRNDEFQLVFQPKVDLKSDIMMGVEALLRWYARDKNIINPSDFIPAAEELGLIHDLGDLILKKTFMQWKEWEQKGLRLSVSINISPVQFMHENFIERIRSIIDQYEMDANYLEFEITENALIQDNDDTVAKLRLIREMGISIAIDDFGKGYSSLNYLKSLPIDVLKIDLSFVRNIQQGGRDLAIIKTILNLGDNLKLKTVAEGIENRLQHNILRDLGCQLGQGFLYSEPLESAEIEIKSFQKK